MSDQQACRCHACVVACVDRPSVTIPGFRNTPPQPLHGVELARYYAAQDELRATIARLRQPQADTEGGER
jgi:hypothetical protein